MALNFPNSPTEGQVYTDAPSGNRWVWDSANTVWKSTSTFTQTITVSSTAPGSPVIGQLWWNQDYGRLLVYYSDGNSSQWVDASPSDYTSALAYLNSNAAFAVANTALQNTSVTLAGNLTVTGNVAVKSNTFSINNVNVSPYGTMKNRIINGDMRIDQRFAGNANNNIAFNQYNIDRWRNNGSAAAKLRYQQNNTNGPGSTVTQTSTGFSNYFGANTVSANTVNAADYWFIAQDIEGFNTADFNWGTASASPVTLSFWVYSSVPGTHGGSLRNYGANRSYPFSYTVSTANTWQYQTITVPGDTTGSWYSNNDIGISVFLSLGVGSNYTSTANGTWQAGNYFNATGTVNVVNNANGSFYLTGVQLEKGSQATGWDWRHYTTELQLCQRYYQPLNTAGMYILMNYIDGTSIYQTNVWYKVSMRTGPSILTSTFSYRVGGTNSNGTVNNVSQASAGVNFADIRLNCPSAVNTVGTAGHCVLDSGWGASAELGVTN